MNKGLGEARKFLSPEDKEALRSVYRTEPTEDANSAEVAQRRRLELKAEIYKRVEQEVYARAEKFGEVLLVEFDKTGRLPFSEIRKAIGEEDGEALAVNYPEMVAAISGLSSEEKTFFLNLITAVENDFNDVTAVEKHIKASVIISHREGAPDESTDSRLLGVQAFELINGPGSSKNLRGSVRYRNDGPFAVLEFTDYQDYLSSHPDSGSTMDAEKEVKLPAYAGYYDQESAFKDAKGNVVGTIPLIAVWDPKAKGTAIKHERGHYFNHLIEESRQEARPPDYRIWTESSKRLFAIEGNAGRFSMLTKGEQITGAYGAELSTLQGCFLSLAKNELLAEFQATENFDYLKHLKLKSETSGQDAVYDWYSEEFTNRLPYIPKRLKELIAASRAEYYRVLEEQVKYLTTINNLIFDNTLPERYSRSFYALLQETPIEEWKSRLSEIYSTELETQKEAGRLSGEYFDYYWKIGDLADARKKMGNNESAKYLINERDRITKDHEQLIIETNRLAASGVPLKKAVFDNKGKIADLVSQMKAVYDEAVGS